MLIKLENNYLSNNQTMPNSITSKIDIKINGNKKLDEEDLDYLSESFTQEVHVAIKSKIKQDTSKIKETVGGHVLERVYISHTGRRRCKVDCDYTYGVKGRLTYYKCIRCDKEVCNICAEMVEKKCELSRRS